MNEHICVIIPARNEQKHIGETLLAVTTQTHQPTRLIIVDDGSIDRTAYISEYYGEVIHLPPHKNSYVGRPELARVLNIALHTLTNECDYVLVIGADHRLPSTYIERLVERMLQEKVVIASGYIEGESYHRDMPRGSGRLYEFSYFRTIGFFPENWGWESYVLFKALQSGYKTKCYRELSSYTLRATKTSLRKIFYLGKAMKALGYDFTYALARMLINKNWFLIKGFLSKNVAIYEDIAHFVKNFQRQSFLSYVLNRVTKKVR